MIKRLFLLVFFFISVINLYCFELNDYCLIIVNTINIGREKGELGRDNSELIGIAPIHPGPLFISNTNQIYIYDEYNFRFNIYDINLYYLSEIEVDPKKNIEIGYIYNVKFDEKENLYIVSQGRKMTGWRFIKINKKDKKVENLNITSKEVMNHYNYFPLLDSIIFYDDSKKLRILDSNGESRSISLVTNQNIFNDNKLGEKIKNKIGFVAELTNYLKKQALILDGNRLLTSKGKEWKNYYNFMHKNIKDIENIKKDIKLDNDFTMDIFLGFDKDDNVYWKGRTKKGMAIIVFNKYGAILDCFKVIKGGVPAISQSGDIYFFETDEKKATIYKISRQW